MKTRVVRWFSPVFAVDLYYVQKWALWDDSELRAYHPTEMGWRYVTSTRELQEACRIAARLAEGGSETQVVAEYGNES